MVPNKVVDFFGRKVKSVFFHVSINLSDHWVQKFIFKLCISFSVFNWWYVVSGIIENKASDVPELVGKLLISVGLCWVLVHVGAGYVINHKTHTKGIGAVLLLNFTWRDYIAFALTHLLAVLVTDHAVQANFLEWYFSSTVQTEHNHTSHPKEQDVLTGLHDRSRVEVFEVITLASKIGSG